MPDLSPEQEFDITAALIQLESAEQLEILRKEGAEIVRNHLGCSHEEGLSVIKDLENRRRIEAQMSPGARNWTSGSRCQYRVSSGLV